MERSLEPMLLSPLLLFAVTTACFETLGLKLRKTTLDYYAKNKTIHQHRQNPHGLHQPTNRMQTIQRRKPRNRICRIPTKTKRE